MVRFLLTAFRAANFRRATPSEKFALTKTRFLPSMIVWDWGASRF
ncbi:MAG: hypothetical protein WKF71_10145 [Pyrinomonadaceae bacterium]